MYFPRKNGHRVSVLFSVCLWYPGDSVVLQRAMFGHEIAHVNYAIVFCFIVVRAPVP
ncbi:MAG: hypothetical protein QOH31_4258, partial [Verrucomicrobiota bacterium]